MLVVLDAVTEVDSCPADMVETLEVTALLLAEATNELQLGSHQQLAYYVVEVASSHSGCLDHTQVVLSWVQLLVVLPWELELQ